MTKPTRTPFTLRPHGGFGSWLSNDRRYYEYARLQLRELEQVVEEVRGRWPVPLGQTVRNGEFTPELWDLVRKRDALSDSVQVFSAMAIEGFLNYYGIVRLGEPVFQENFERLGVVPKIRTLLLVCDSLSVEKSDPLVRLIVRVAQRRNALVHPKAKEVEGYVPAEHRGGDKIPEVARDAVAEMDEFFREFVAAVPDADHLVPKPREGNSQ